MKIVSYSSLSFLATMSAIAVGFMSNPKSAIAQDISGQMIEMMTGMGQQVISQIEQSPCENFSSSMPENHLTKSQRAFKEQMTTQFISIFQRFLQDVPSSPENFRQTSSLMFNKLYECALKKPRY